MYFQLKMFFPRPNLFKVNNKDFQAKSLKWCYFLKLLTILVVFSHFERVAF